MENILVTGGSGQLGSEIKELSINYNTYRFFIPYSSELDITKYNDVEEYINNNRINIIINCAAYTNVDKAEFDYELADKINHKAVKNLAKLSKSKKIKLIHISTDYVFDGRTNKPYKEYETPNPQTNYGRTKLDGELAMKKINPNNSIIIRTSWLYSKFGNNFVKKVLHLAKLNKQINVVSDEIGSPTNASDLAFNILKILPKIKNKNVELYHFANEGFCSWHEFAKEIFKINKIDINLASNDSKNFSKKLNRPKYSVLSTSTIKNKFNLEIPTWIDSLNNNFNIEK